MKLFGPKKRATVAQTPQASIGIYTGVPLPQDPRQTLLNGILPTLLGVGPSTAAVRLASKQANYYGTDTVPPINFPLTGEPHVNQPADLETAIYKAGQ